MMNMDTIKLNNGVEMPQLGYGVFQVSPVEAERCVADALNVGYRMIDTAQAYQNEEGVGTAIRKSGIKRENVFLVDKVWMGNYEDDAAARSIDESLRKLGTDYIDLMLLHQPFGDRYNAYRALEDALKAGKVRAIGVSNFYPDHLIDLSHFVDVVPAVNQVETHVFFQQTEARKYMDELGVAHMSWGPLAEGKNEFFSNETLAAIGAAHGKTGPQVALRYLLQRGIIVIPKSTHKERMAQNLQLFDFTLTDKEMNEILKLDTGQPIIMPSHHDPEITKMFMGFAPR
jgi:organophosphate reductase